MRDQYKRALDKIKLCDSQKEQLRDLYYADSKERKYHMKKRIFRPAAVLAACLALVIAANTVVPMLQSRWESSSGYTAGNATENAKTDNYFAITAYAKELTKTGKVFPDKYVSIGSGICGDSKKKDISFAFEFPVECKGKNIDTITYMINEGAFQISNKTGENIVVDGEKVKKELNVPGTFKGVDEKKDQYIDYETNQYKSFTVKYDRQMNKTTSIEVVDASNVWSGEKLKRYREKDIYTKAFSTSIKKEKEACDFLMKNLGIACTVNYKDGSTETKNVAVSNEIGKLSELYKEEAKDEEIPKEKDEIVIRYFSIQ